VGGGGWLIGGVGDGWLIGGGRWWMVDWWGRWWWLTNEAKRRVKVTTSIVTTNRSVGGNLYKVKLRVH